MADRAKKARMPGTALRRPSSSGLRMRLRNLARTPRTPVMNRERTISAMVMGMVIIMMVDFLLLFFCLQYQYSTLVVCGASCRPILRFFCWERNPMTMGGRLISIELISTAQS